MKYSIHKDSDVNKTVNKIKNIYSDLGIEIQEINHEYPIKDKKMPYSSSLYLMGKIRVSNGKGASYENARASAYSEFMERLQNNYIQNFMYGPDKFNFAADETVSDKANYNSIKKYYDKKELKFFCERIYSQHQFFTVPFYNIFEKKVKELPLLVLYTLQSTNGMVAGNTPEEALVQGLSEVCERYAKKIILSEKISMPEIPEKIWSKYTRIKELKEYLEQYGYEIQIKDASLGQNLPVVCVTFENKEEGFYGFDFGSHPSLPIAIERTFTEIMQGKIPSTQYDTIESTKEKSIDSDYIYEFCTCMNCSIIKSTDNKDIYNQFINDAPDYKFSKTAWLRDNKGLTNKKILEFIIKNAEIFKNRDIYVRDVSFLNFPAYIIYVPNISEVYHFDINRALKRDNFFKWQDYTNDFLKDHEDINSLISALEYKNQYLEFYTKDKFVCKIPNTYLLALCYTVKQDTKNILKYCKNILTNKNLKSYHKRAEFIYDYFNFRKTYPKKFRTKLEEKYSKNYIDNMVNFITSLTFEKIKQTISTNNKKALEKIQYQAVVNTDSKEPEYNNIEEKLTKIKETLAIKYIENIPNQMKLAEIFDFV